MYVIPTNNIGYLTIWIKRYGAKSIIINYWASNEIGIQDGKRAQKKTQILQHILDSK